MKTKNCHKPRIRKKKEQFLNEIEFTILLKQKDGEVFPIGRGKGFANHEGTKVQIKKFVYDLTKVVDGDEPIWHYITVMPNQWTSKEMGKT